jgi:SAM domain (Sterile alpha motif)
MDVVVWLRSLGLGKYEAAFRENEIDETVLPSLTHETLKELGVTAVGHRLKLLDAIAALRKDASGKPHTVDAATASSAPSAHPESRSFRSRAWTRCSLARTRKPEPIEWDETTSRATAVREEAPVEEEASTLTAH